jgi:ADP-ribosylglycohydrolase
MEGLSGKTISASFPDCIDRYYLLGNIGFVSDDTEQSALVAQSLVRYPHDSGAATKAFKLAMLGWFSRLPFGVGRATSQSCLKMLTGAKETGINSAGNGAAMRAAIIGVFYHDNQPYRLKIGKSIACSTHLDQRAIDGALFVAELAAAAYTNRNSHDPNRRYQSFDSAISVVQESSLRQALDLARNLAQQQANIQTAAQELGCSGFVNHSVALAAFAFLRWGDDTLAAIQWTIKAGGDTDSNAAIVGAWCGALLGEQGLPANLIDKINDGPFGPSHLRQLACALGDIKYGKTPATPTYLWPTAMARNILLIPIILSHTLKRLMLVSPKTNR